MVLRRFPNKESKRGGDRNSKRGEVLPGRKKSGPGGSVYICKGKNTRSSIYTWKCIYCPNKNLIGYLMEILGKLMDFKKGELIMAGDLNFCTDPKVDSSSTGHRETSA